MKACDTVSILQGAHFQPAYRAHSPLGRPIVYLEERTCGGLWSVWRSLFLARRPESHGCCGYQWARTGRALLGANIHASGLRVLDVTLPPRLTACGPPRTLLSNLRSHHTLGPRLPKVSPCHGNCMQPPLNQGNVPLARHGCDSINRRLRDGGLTGDCPTRLSAQPPIPRRSSLARAAPRDRCIL